MRARRILRMTITHPPKNKKNLSGVRKDFATSKSPPSQTFTTFTNVDIALETARLILANRR